MKKAIKKMITVGIWAVVMVTPVYAGTWNQDEIGYWYLNDSNSYARDQIMNIDGVNYGFNQQAYMVTGWANFDGNWYYFDPATGAQTSGWQCIDNVWYYLNPAKGNAMNIGFVKVGNELYYMEASGVMKTGTFSADGYTYFAESNGAIRRNKIETEGNITIRYDDEGRQWYKNDENRVYKQSGGDLWLPVLDAAGLLQQREAVQEYNQDYIEEVKDDLFEEYKTNVLTANGTKNLTKALKKWTEKVNRKLAELYVSEESINSYIYDVKSGYYDNDDYYNDSYYDEDYIVNYIYE